MLAAQPLPAGKIHLNADDIAGFHCGLVLTPGGLWMVNLSGRGDKDIGTVADLSGAEFYCRPSCRGQTVKGGAR